MTLARSFGSRRLYVPSGDSVITPASFNGLWMWYDLNDISTVVDDGADITVSDKAGPWGQDSVGPTSAFDYGVHTINGKSTLSSKASGIHTTSTSTPVGTRASARRIMFLVAERINKGTGFTFVGSNAFLMFWRASGTLDDTFYHRSTADQVTEFRHQHDTTSIFGELSGPYLITAEWTNSGFDVDIYVNNVFWVSLSEGSGVILSEGVRLINRQTNPAPDVALAEVIQYTTDDGLDWTIGDPEYDDLVTYLSDRWGLGL